MTRAQYGCTVLRSQGAPWSGELNAELGAARVEASRPGVRVAGGPAGSGAAVAMVAIAASKG